jgi:ribosomal-protein-alanine N-acetyltransferase
MFFEKKPILLESDRTYFRALDLRDFEALCRLHADHQIMRFLDGPRDQATVLGRLNEWQEHHLKHGFAIWGVFDRETEDFIGCAGLFYLRMDDTQGEIELAYALLTEYWDKGLGTEICKALIEFGFGIHNFKRIWAITRKQNRKSQHILKKIGFNYRYTDQHQGDLAHFYAVEAPVHRLS